MISDTQIVNRTAQTLLSLALCTCGCVAQESSVPANTANRSWTVRGHIPLEKFVIYSHRGAGELVPENTLAAFEKGWQMGTVPEAALRTTRDWHHVPFHDPISKHLQPDDDD